MSALVEEIEQAGPSDSSRFHLGHSPQLDGLRGIAILIVVFGHLFRVGSPALGVDLFFVLSGFLITILLVAEHEKHGRIRLSYFYMRRVLRLLPALVLVLIGVFLGERLGWLYFPGHVLPFVLTYTTNLAMAFGWISPVHQFNPLAPLWSLAIEEQFYTVWPVVFIWLSRRSTSKERYPIRTLLVLLLVWEVYRWWMIATSISAPRIYYGTDTHAQLLLIGCLLALIRMELPVCSSFTTRTRSYWNLYILVVTLLVLLSPRISFDLYNMLCTLWGILFSGLVWATTIPLTAYNRFLRWSWLRFFGRISYGLYLYHIPVMLSCETWMSDRDQARLLAFFLSVLVAWLSFVLVEQPILRLKKRYQR